MFPELWDALADARTNIAADANSDGVVSICVEPGTYFGGHELFMEDSPAPLWIWSSKGPAQTLVRGLHPLSAIDRAFHVIGSVPPPLPIAWPHDVVLRGFDISHYLAAERGAGVRVDGPSSVKIGASRFLDDRAVTGGGGGVAAHDAILRLSSVTFDACEAVGDGKGGALLAHASGVDLWNVTVTGGSANQGGCFRAEGDGSWQRPLDVRKSTFVGCEATAWQGPGGGGCGYIRGFLDATFSETVFADCVAVGNGGGLSAFDVAELTIEGSSNRTAAFWGNVADDGAGGGLRVGGSVAGFPAPRVTLHRVEFQQNSATWEGGGASVARNGTDLTLALTDGLFTGNESSGAGGGALSASTVGLSVEKCSFHGNVAAGSGGGIAVLGDGPATVVHSSLSSNRAYGHGGGVACEGTETLSLLVSESGIVANDALPGSPSLFTPTSSGGGLFAAGCSLAVQTSVIAENCAETGAGLAAFGPVEIVAATFAENGGGGSRHQCPLLPLVGGGAKIVLGQDVPLLVAESLFDGNAARGSGGGLAVHCAVPPSSSPPQVGIAGSSFLGNAVLDEPATTALEGDGGGVFTTGCSASLQETTFQANHADAGGGGAALVGWAAGAPGSPADTSLSSVVFHDNSAHHGAGLRASFGAFELVGGGFDGNEATNGSGGGALIEAGAVMSLAQTAFHDNSAASVGGALHSSGEALTLTNVLVAENAQSGGAVSVSSGASAAPSVVALDHVTVAGNHGHPGSPPGVHGLRFEVGSGGSPVTGTVVDSVIAMNEGTQQAMGSGLVFASTSLFYAHAPPTTDLVQLTDGSAFALANGCFGANPEFEGGSLSTNPTPLVPSTSNFDPWSAVYDYYVYGSAGVLVGAASDGSDLGAFGGVGGGFCAGLEPDTCVP